MMKRLSLVLLLSVPGMLYAQNRPEHIERMYTGVEYMNEGDYETADKYFRWVIKHAPVLPNEICYFFGKNSYHLGRYKQSINWLNKYIELNGMEGEYFEETTEYLNLSEEKYRQEVLNNADTAQIALYPEDFSINCGVLNKVICPVCKGRGVLVTPSPLSTQYETCPYCDEHGYMGCDDFNDLLRGDLSKK